MLSFVTTDHAALAMEAHQRLPHPIDVSCCSAIGMAIAIADIYPRTITMELILMDGDLVQSLGTVPVPGQKEATLDFPIPAGSALRQFRELKIVFHRDIVRMDRSARFVLTPRL